MNALSGIGGSLLPGRYIADHLLADLATTGAERSATTHRQLRQWWRVVSEECGPATGLRALFDVAAMPLAALLGFRTTSATFFSHMATARLEARDRHGAGDVGATPVALVVTPWAHRSPSVWRDAVLAAQAWRADWCLLVAPPFVQIIDTTRSTRRALEFTFPDVLDTHEGCDRFFTAAQSRALTRPLSTQLTALANAVARADAMQHAVRQDLQHGVADSLDALSTVLPSHDESLAVVYRVLFLLFAEARDLLPWQHPLYGPAYSISRMCRAAADAPTAPGYWPALGAISRLLRLGCRTPTLDVRPFNSHLFSRAAAPSLERRPLRANSRRARHEDAAIARTLINVSTRTSRHGREFIAYPDLGVEQLGAVYERVLGHPHRKQSGSFYTPRPLTECVVRRTLSPLTRSATADSILRLRVVDPAMGSGAFLVAACRHLAHAYERALIREGRLSEHEVDHHARADFRRLIAQHCLYGVDRNPVAVQLARLSLWLATLSGGKPLTFLDHRLRTGDALVGARPEDVQRVTRARRTTAALPLFESGELEVDLARIAAPLSALAEEPDDDVRVVRKKEAAFAALSAQGSTLSRWRLALHLWCARWFPVDGRATSDAEVRAGLDAVLRADRTLPAATLSQLLSRTQQAADHGRFFHWPLEFADVFFDPDGQPRTDSGFDAVVGNPPWEMLRADHGDNGKPAQLVQFIRESGLYSACGRGHMNLYQPFLERALNLTRPGGQVGLVLPWGLASDDGAAQLRARLMDECNTSTLLGLDNADAIFPVHRGLRFLVAVTSPGGRVSELQSRCGVRTTDELDRICGIDGDLVEPLRVSRGTLQSVGGVSRRWPDVRNAQGLQLLDALAHRFPAVGADGGWRVRFGRELNVTEDREAFGDVGLPVIEGKDIQPFALDVSAPKFRIASEQAARTLPSMAFSHARLAYRDVSAVSNKQSLIAAIVPADVVTTHTLYCLKTPMALEQQYFLCACFNSFVLNAVVRMLMGGHLTTGLVEGLPVPPWTGSARQRRIARLAARLARSRPAVRGGAPSDHPAAARLQALVAHEYGVDRPTIEHILDGFPLISSQFKKTTLKHHGDILMYD